MAPNKALGIIEMTMQPAQAAQVFPIFAVTWVILGVGSFIFFSYNKNAALKRKAWPIMVIGAGALFLTFGWLMGFRGQPMYFMAPFVLLITALNLKGTKFCDSCGKTIMARSPFTSTRFCPDCGTELPK
jgi:hypothetical protein